MKSILTLLCLLLTVFALHAQELPRRGQLGIHARNATPEDMKLSRSSDGYGVVLEAISPNSTSSKLGLSVGDRIEQFNGIPVSDMQALLAAIKTVPANQSFTVEFYRGHEREPRTAKAKMMALPKDTLSGGYLEYDALKLHGGRARTITAYPDDFKAGEKRPAILLIPGYPCQSLDNLPFFQSYRKLIRGYVEKGYIVHRIEKSNMGDSRGMPPCVSVTFKEEVALFTAGLRQLKGLDGVDKKRVFIFGHSLGGVQAPHVSLQEPLAGIILYGMTPDPWAEYMVKMWRIQNPLYGQSADQIEELVTILQPIVQAWLIDKKPLVEIYAKQDAEVQELMRGMLNYDPQTQRALLRDDAFWQSLQDTDLKAALRKVDAQVLSMYGECDVQALNADGHIEVEKIVNSTPNGKAEFDLLEGTDHSFIKCETKADALENMRNVEYIDANFNPQIIERTHAWMQNVSAN